ncbi:ABC transporter permease [Hymenobacter saemangeumensis]|uniref:ABC transporter permease n=1 Tax=Hymenobacter saemangeumensis TaxID=1084522 RepID=A0ABP8I6V7_9BACT
MLLNYLKIAWRVLLRRKFFTFISLFGISFTLMVLLVVFALFDHLTGAHMPEKRMDRMLFVSSLRQEMQDNQGWMNSPMSVRFIDTYVRTMKTPERVALTSSVGNATAFANNKLMPLDIRYTDGEFWNIMEFDFLDGRAFTASEVKQSQPVCVVNEATARAYFGTAVGVVGKIIEIDLKRFRVAGVVPNVSAAHIYSYSDVWVPYTLSRNVFSDNRLSGDFIPVLLAPSAAKVDEMYAEYNQVISRVEIPNPKEVMKIYSWADPVLASFTRQLFFDSTTKTGASGLEKFYLIVSVLGLLFMLLPTLNLVNLNVTRILERSSEIGVRKAFGASSRTLVGQFLVENVVLACLGGALGLLMAAATLALLNDLHVVAYAQFNLSGRVFGYGLLLTLFFGLLSGVYPAWKMSRLNPAVALHGNADRN